MKHLFIGLICIMNTLSAACQQHGFLGEKIARDELKQALSENKTVTLKGKPIKNKATAITVAETYLFKVYGKKQILTEKPYEVYLINGYWVMNGTIPKGWDGGGFLIIVNSANGQVIKVTHYK